MEDIKIIIDTNAEQAGKSFDDLSKKFKNADNSAKDLRKEIKELKSELFNLRFQHATNQLDNPMKIVETKKSIAKVMTVIKEKEMNA